jgi:hypothetical protein
MMNASFIGLLMDYDSPITGQSQNTHARYETEFDSVHAIKQQAKKHRFRYLSKLLKKQAE